MGVPSLNQLLKECPDAVENISTEELQARFGGQTFLFDTSGMMHRFVNKCGRGRWARGWRIGDQSSGTMARFFYLSVEKEGERRINGSRAQGPEGKKNVG